MFGFDEAGEDGKVRGSSRDEEIEEVELAKAGVGLNILGMVSDCEDMGDDLVERDMAVGLEEATGWLFEAFQVLFVPRYVFTF